MTPNPPPSATVRLLGDGYEPHVDQLDGWLRYSIPVDSGHMTFDFEFEIGPADLAVLRADPYRRAALYMVLHAVLQRSTIRGNPPITADDFRAIATGVLFAAPDDLSTYIAAVGTEHHIVLDRYIAAELQRHGG